jgi:D-alanyl-D-alanine carboxypeptidase
MKLTTNPPLRLMAPLLATLTLAGAAQAMTPSSRQSQIAVAADAAVAAGVPGLVVYARYGKQTTLLARGYDKLDTKRPMTTDDRFRIGSVTKTFVATVVMQLVQEHRLALDDTIEQHLPGLVPNGRAITVRQLLSHTSGLPDYFSNKRIYAPYLNGHLTYIWSHQAIVRISTRDKPLFAPGAPGRWAYSNTGYYILGLMIERITGHTLGSELARRIFRPLKLAHTSLPETPALPGRYAHGYTPSGANKLQDISHISPSILWAAGGIVSTPADVASFQRALFQGRLLPHPLVRQMQTTQIVLPGTRGRQTMGLGLFKTRFPCSSGWGHGGDLPGYTTSAYSSPNAQRQIVLAVNAGEEDALTTAARDAIAHLITVAYC